MINLNPLSPFSGTPLDKCYNRERDAWCHSLVTDNFTFPSSTYNYYHTKEPAFVLEVPRYTTSWAAAGPLMKRLASMSPQGDIHLDHLGSGEENDDGLWGCGRCCDDDNTSDENACGEWFIHEPTAPLAITTAFIIAAEHARAKENGDAENR